MSVQPQQQRILKSRSLQTINPTPPHHDSFYSGTSSQSCNNINNFYDTTNNSSSSGNRNSIDSSYYNNNYNNSGSNNSSNRNSIDNSNGYGYDQNFDVLKGEYYNLSTMIYNVYDSLNSYCNSIKDIYLNSNSFMNNIQRYFGSDHPLSKYGFGVVEMANQGFGEWMDNQQSNFQLLGQYVQELDTVKSKIDRVDQLSLQLNDTNIGEYMALKDELFKQVSDQIDNRVNKFDIPLIQTQLSFSSLYQCLNTIHETNGNENLQQPIKEVENPIRNSNLLPDNTFYYQQQQQQQQESLEQAQAYEQIYQPPPPPLQQQQQVPQVPQQIQQRPTSTYSNPNMLLSKPVKTEIPHTSANGPKKLERVGVREYARAPPQPSQASPLKQIPRPPPSTNYTYQQPSVPPQPSAPPQQEYIEQPAEPVFKQQSNIFRQVLPVSNNPPPSSNNNNNNNNNNESGVIEQPLRPVPHKSVQARPPLGGPLNNNNNNKPPLSPQQPPQPLQSSKPPPLRPVSGNFSQQPPSPRSTTTQPNPLSQIQRPSPSPFVQNNNNINNNNNNVQQPQQQNQSFSRPLPNVVSSVQSNNTLNSNPPVNRPAVNRHLRTNSVDRYSHNNNSNNQL